MAANVSPIFTLVPHITGTSFTSADTIAEKVLFTPGVNGSRIDGIFCTTSDTVAVNLAFYINDGTTDHYIGVVNVPIGSGYTTIVRVDAIGTLAPSKVGALILPSGYTLKANCVATMSVSVTTSVTAIGGDF